MASVGNLAVGELKLSATILGKLFNREPFEFLHGLSTLDIFELEAIRALSDRYLGCEQDYFVASGASAPDEKFRASKPMNLGLSDAFSQLERKSVRILLKRPENYDPRFRQLLDQLIAQVVDLLGGLEGDRIIRLYSSILITSAKSLTPFHFDPSIGFFCQIKGEKVYHVYPPLVLTEPELEQFYFRGLIDIGQVQLNKRDAKQECVFNLNAGKGFHQPQNAPHWVETCGDLSVSFTFNFETLLARKLGRTRGFNYYMRKVGARPAPPGTHPYLDTLKADAMRMWVPCRKTLSAIKSAAMGK
jgi:hypothetical protein